MVTGGVSKGSKGHGFESQQRLLDGQFFTFICCKNYNVHLKIPK